MAIVWQTLMEMVSVMMKKRLVAWMQQLVTMMLLQRTMTRHVSSQSLTPMIARAIVSSIRTVTEFATRMKYWVVPMQSLATTMQMQLKKTARVNMLLVLDVKTQWLVTTTQQVRLMCLSHAFML